MYMSFFEQQLIFAARGKTAHFPGLPTHPFWSQCAKIEKEAISTLLASNENRWKTINGCYTQVSQVYGTTLIKINDVYNNICVPGSLCNLTCTWVQSCISRPVQGQGMCASLVFPPQTGAQRSLQLGTSPAPPAAASWQCPAFAALCLTLREGCLGWCVYRWKVGWERRNAEINRVSTIHEQLHGCINDALN